MKDGYKTKCKSKYIKGSMKGEYITDDFEHDINGVESDSTFMFRVCVHCLGREVKH